MASIVLEDNWTVTLSIIASYFRCIAIVPPLKKMEWMKVRAAKRKIIPLVILACLAYTSYRVLIVVKADPGILACDAVSGTSIIVSKQEGLSVDGRLPAFQQV